MPRKEQYALETFIDAERGVIYKRALSHGSLSFLLSLPEKYKHLSDIDKEISFNKIINIEDDKIHFEFIRGQTLEQIILEGSSLEKNLLRYYNIIDSFSLSKITNLDISQGSKVFGNSYGKDTEYVKSGVLDLILSNIIIDNLNLEHIIDYEWVFDFPISKKFIIWRSLYYYVANNKDSKNLDIIFKLIKTYGKVNWREELRYFSLEFNFQSFVHEGEVKTQYYKILGFYFLILRCKFLRILGR